jgi:hypothetical protein
MVRASELIVVGTVAKILPSYNPDPAHPVSIETESLVTVTDVLYESRPLGTSTIDLAQTGGKVGKCTEVVPADPLVSVGEEYVLFLRADRRKNVPNTSGAPRYYAVGLWSGKVKVVDGKVKFLPSASAGLHKYDGVEKRAFLDTVTNRIDVLFRGKQPS